MTTKKKRVAAKIVIGVFWAGEEQFGVGIPQSLNEGYKPLDVEAVATFVEELDELLNEKFGDSWHDATMLRSMCRAAGLPTSDYAPRDDFRRVDMR